MACVAPWKHRLSREVGRQFNSCQCISRRHWTVWKASSLPHHPTLFFFTKAWRKAATWEGRQKNIWKLEVLSDNFKREQEFKKKVEAKKKKKKLYLTGQESLTFYYFSSPNCLLLYYLFVSSLLFCLDNYSPIEFSPLCRIGLDTYYVPLANVLKTLLLLAPLQGL